MTTRKQKLNLKFKELEVFLKLHIMESLFPSLEDIDEADLVYYITLSFLGVIDYQQFEKRIIELLEGNRININDLTIQIIIPPIMDFVIWLRTL